MTASLCEFEALMAKVRAGSNDAARELVNRFGPQIRRVVHRRLNARLRARYDSLDFMQAMWASFFAGEVDSNRLDTPEKLVSFLSGVARHKVVDAYRRR